MTEHPILRVLNTAVRDDRAAIERLVLSRVPCKEELGDHETIQCGYTDNGTLVVGLLGIVNGICAELGLPVIAAKVLTDHDPHRLIGFCEYEEINGEEEGDAEEDSPEEISFQANPADRIRIFRPE